MLFSTLVMSSCGHIHKYGPAVTTKPSCFTDGATYTTCTICGQVNYESYVKATGHTLNEWTNNIRFLNSTAVCSECGFTIERTEYTAPEGIAQLFFYGEPKGVEIPIKITYIDKNKESHEHVGKTRYDSNTENLHYKRDYDFTVLDSEGYENTVVFDETLGYYSGYTLKAEYVDKSYVRNAALSDVWSEVVKSRVNLDKNIKKLAFFGAEKCVPVLFYTNDNFKGLHMLCTPNDQNLFNMKNEEKQSLIYTYTDFSIFDFTYKNGNEGTVPCTVIWPKQEDLVEKTKKNFIEFCNFVNTSDDISFKKDIKKYLDVDAAIDYMLCVYAFGADENALNYCNWASYDGEKWIPSMYNLTYTLGLDSKHRSYQPEESFAPYFDGNGDLISGTGSVLFDRLLKLYYNDIKERYISLRDTALSVDNVSQKFNYYSSLISEEVDRAENEEYPEKRFFETIDSVEEIVNWYSQKVAIIDNIIK